MSTPWLRMRPGYGSEGSTVERQVEQRMSQADMDRVMAVLRAAVPDEEEAWRMYNELQDLLRRTGNRRLADQVAKIARDESNHRLTLLDIQMRLTRR
jgi:rubrerythrin